MTFGVPTTEPRISRNPGIPSNKFQRPWHHATEFGGIFEAIFYEKKKLCVKFLMDLLYPPDIWWNYWSNFLRGKKQCIKLFGFTLRTLVELLKQYSTRKKAAHQFFNRLNAYRLLGECFDLHEWYFIKKCITQFTIFIWLFSIKIHFTWSQPSGFSVWETCCDKPALQNSYSLPSDCITSKGSHHLEKNNF